MHGQDVLVQVRSELNNNITNVTSGDGPLVDNFLVFNESLNTRVGVVTVFAGKHSGRQKNLYSGEKICEQRTKLKFRLQYLVFINVALILRRVICN